MLFSSKKFTIFIIAALVVPVLSVLGYNLYIDPFQIFHKDLKQPTVILGGRGVDRYQQAGIIKQYDIQSIILGHSHSANYLPSQLKKDLRWEKVYSLTMDGSFLYEHAVVANAVFSRHQVENVLWGLHVGNFMRDWGTKNKKLPLKEYLYDANQFNDLRFFLTFDLHKYDKQRQDRKNQILESKNSFQLAEEEFDKATSWYDRNVCGFNRPAFIADKILRGQSLQYDVSTRKKIVPLTQQTLVSSPPKENIRFLNYQDNLYKNILPIVRKNPQSTFNFVLTAFPTLKMQFMKITTPGRYKQYLQIVRQFVLDTQDFKNVKIFGFDQEKFTEDLRLYKDQTHYHIAVNNFIIEQISLKNNLLTSGNIDKYVLALDEKVSRFRLSDRWNPQFVEGYPESGYVSMEAAKVLIDGERPYSDAEITGLSLQNVSLPNCATVIKNGFNANTIKQ